MKSILLVIGVICFFSGFESAFLKIELPTTTQNPERDAPQAVCPLSKTIMKARDTCLTQLVGVGGELNIYESAYLDLIELFNDQNPDAMAAFVEKYGDLMMCFVQSTGLIDNTGDEAIINQDVAQEMLAEVDVDPHVYTLINDELKNCVGKSLGAELINCVMVGMDKVCGFGLLPNIAAQQMKLDF